jgi:hypothetical protein
LEPKLGCEGEADRAARAATLAGWDVDGAAALAVGSAIEATRRAAIIGIKRQRPMELLTIFSGDRRG